MDKQNEEKGDGGGGFDLDSASYIENQHNRVIDNSQYETSSQNSDIESDAMSWETVKSRGKRKRLSSKSPLYSQVTRERGK